MKIEHNTSDRVFEAFDVDGKKMGDLEYMIGGGNELYATHTEVYSAYEGRGLASELVDALFEYAVSIDAKVIPVCTYVIYAFRENAQKYSRVFKNNKTNA